MGEIVEIVKIVGEMTRLGLIDRFWPVWLWLLGGHQLVSQLVNYTGNIRG